MRANYRVRRDLVGLESSPDQDNCAMISIVDIHLFKDEKEALIPKEVAFVAEENDFIAYWDTSPSASLK